MLTDVFTDYLAEILSVVDAHLNTLIQPIKSPESELFEAARYALLGGGKRLRPIFTLAFVDVFKGDFQKALTPACCVELIHTYSLIHDDLPCMDDDDYRRGKLTVHKQFNEGLAVLTGDFLLTYAFELLAELTALPLDIRLSLISTLAQKSGVQGMIGGQVLDIASEGKTLQLDEVIILHKKKTAALLEASVLFAGILCKVSLEEMRILQKFGESIGLTYQVVDDILDVTASSKQLGKHIGSDIRNQKSTFVTLQGVEHAKLSAYCYYEQSIGYLNRLERDTSLIQELCSLIIKKIN